jgi:hypothetical protein
MVAKNEVPVVMYTLLIRRCSPAILFYSISAGDCGVILDVVGNLGECKKFLVYLIQLRIIIITYMDVANHHQKFVHMFVINVKIIFNDIKI